MSTLHRLENEAPEDLFGVIAMIVSKISIKKVGPTSYEYTFLILQNEFDGMTEVSYTCESKEQELKLVHLPEPMGTLVFMSHCIKESEKFELEYDPEMAVVAMRPNVYQVQNFLKGFIQSYELTSSQKLKITNIWLNNK